MCTYKYKKYIANIHICDTDFDLYLDILQLNVSDAEYSRLIFSSNKSVCE